MSTLQSLLFLGLLLSLVSTAPPAPSNVTVRSQNFRHILTWQPADISGTSLFYRVQYVNINGDRKRYVPKHCSNTSALKCDLTDELSDIYGPYSLQVQSLSPIGDGSRWARTQFSPLEETILGPPIVHITACDSCINVTIQPPVSHLKSADKTRTESLLDVYHILKYVVTLKGSRGIHNEISEEAAVEHFTKIIDNLLPKSNYCISVIATATSNLNNFGIPSAFKCIVTESSSSETGAESTIMTIAFGVVAAVVVLTLLIVLNAAGFICLRIPPFPKALCSSPKSESAFRENDWNVLTDKVCPVDVVFKDKRKKEYYSEETDESDTEVSCEDYKSRLAVRANSTNVANNSNSANLKTLADSSLVDVSGHETLSTALTDSEELQSVVGDESGASKGMTPLIDDCSSGPLNHSGSFNVNLDSVMLGTLPKLQGDDSASEASSQGEQDSSVSSQDSSTPLLAFDLSGHETLSTALTDSEEHQSIVCDESGASKGMTPLMDDECSSAPLDNSGSFNVNLDSVMLGTLPKLRGDDAASEASSQGDQDSSVSSQDSSAPLLAFDFNLLMDKIGAVGPKLPVVSDDSFANEVTLTDESESDDTGPNRVSEYMSR